MTRDKDRRKQLPTEEEIEEIIRDPGYSAGKRKSKLKEILTEIQSDKETRSDPERDRLLRLVKESIDDLQDGKPIADDTL